MNNYVAIDIGASSGRLILGQVIHQKLKLREIHRFKNGFRMQNKHDRWQIDDLIAEIFTGLEKLKREGISSCTLGIDTWGVDYVMIDSHGEKLADPISYRDKRMQNKMEELVSIYPKEYIYQKTGIQFLELNTLYQLYAEDKKLIQQAEKIILIPDYIGYILTGKQVAETTNSSTTQMLNLREQLFDQDLLEHIGLKADKFADLTDAGTSLGQILPKWYKHYDLPECNVITVATHDTASAVLGTPGTTNSWAFLSSGTWSLLGMELTAPITSEQAFLENYTNEWGAYGTYRFLKNIMGMWIIQEIARVQDYAFSYAEMERQANEYPYFTSIIDVNDSRFNNPANMITAIQDYCQETNQQVPQTIGELTNCVYSSLAICYRDALQKLAEITGKKPETLHIVGGGSHIDILNQLTANLTGIPVFAGPSEATAIGNLVVQMITTGKLENIRQARNFIRSSFHIKKYYPETASTIVKH